ncbi:SusC/RagA family TonB-linked outer membrane protein [Adhaeribacter aerolatus]|uniref:SusC/RagA family TonB-linked outer membrane protein n=1 Tax=Adhaeribacter aerolatus TaxID=670289 RepID=A0A512B5F8_9BACT|nr:TonB-dependent receptor [Adhaeribacter aerolatus]GEO07203.1 SusC/RagA family TonB-linked outer membrane protein [Adhaeribacter aerolatus]
MKQPLLERFKYFLILNLLFLAVIGAQAQGLAVKGRVTAENGDGLPGVTVLVKGTSNGTATDANGNYALNVANGTGTLVISFIGYNTQEVPLNNRTTINVTMAPDAKALEEVVVVGYGVQKKETVTGSVAAVKGAELVKSPTVNLSNSLAGRLPGVVAVNRSGEPGYDGSAIRIRGSNTLNNNSALVVIDGVPGRAGGLDRINPKDIESVSVLKDAAAAIYGSRAANGVILITTKRGKTGKPQLSYDFNQGYSQPTVIPDLTSSAEYTSMLNDLNVYELPVSEWAAATEAYKKTGTYTRPNGTVRNAPYTPNDLELYRNGTDPWLHPNTDWYKATLKNWSPQTRHNLQVTGGTDNLKYLASMGYQNQDGYYKNSATGYKQYDIRVNLDATINKYVKATIGLLGREELRMFPTRPASAIFRMQMRGKPQEQAYWPNGMPGPDIENGENPVVITTDLSGYQRDKRDFFQTNGALDVLIPGVEGLKFTGTAAIDKQINSGKNWQIPWTLYQRGTGVDANGNPNLVATKRGPSEPRLDQSTFNQLNILLGGVLNYERKFGDHGLTLLAGTNRETINSDGFNAFRRYFISPAIDQMFAGGDLEKNNGGSAEERARINYFGRAAYNFKEKYLLEFLWRYDGSDIFPEQTRYGFFPGVMAGWVVSEENFFKNAIPAINYLKLRGSWGQLGNDDVGRYAYLSTFGFRTYILNNIETKTIYETRIPNNTITWEVANNSNVGLEGSAFDGRFSFEFDAFYNKRTNILASRSASYPQSTGIIPPLTNFGEVSNKGFEYNIGYQNQVGEFKYNVSVNGGYAKNKIIFRDEAPGAPEWQRATGMPMFTFLTYQYDGVFKDQAEIDANPIDYKALVNQLRPGDMKYKDIGGRDAAGNFTRVPDGKITPDDQVRTDVTNIPPFQGGVVLGGSFKNFDLSILFQGAAGAKQYIYTGEMGNIGNYLQYIHDNRWTVENPSSEHPRITNRGDQYYSFNNTYWLRDTDYIRLKNLELGYTLPTALSSKAGINNLRVYVNGLNIFTWDKLKVYDPETDNTNGQYYPQARILSGGVSVTF